MAMGDNMASEKESFVGHRVGGRDKLNANNEVTCFFIGQTPAPNDFGWKSITKRPVQNTILVIRGPNDDGRSGFEGFFGRKLHSALATIVHFDIEGLVAVFIANFEGCFPVASKK
jgi:hypothetical protein